MSRYLRFLKQLLLRCAWGSHQWVALTDGNRTLYVCECCRKQLWGKQ